jgi:hypothetical protein
MGIGDWGLGILGIGDWDGDFGDWRVKIIIISPLFSSIFKLIIFLL